MGGCGEWADKAEGWGVGGRHYHDGVFFCLWLRERDGVKGMIDDFFGRFGGLRSF